MNIWAILILSMGLCFDSFAVSLSTGMAPCDNKRLYFPRFALVLALFQGAMPLVGWSMAVNLQGYIQAYDHWIAFGLLSFLGVKMIAESSGQQEQNAPGNPFNLRRTCVLGIATSIDALVTGVAMALITLDIFPSSSQLVNILTAIFIIGSVTFASCMTGLFLGHKASSKIGNRAVRIGGFLLIAIGIKILFEHLAPFG